MSLGDNWFKFLKLTHNPISPMLATHMPHRSNNFSLQHLFQFLLYDWHQFWVHVSLLLSKVFGFVLQWNIMLNNVSLISVEIIVSPCKFILVFLVEDVNFSSLFNKTNFFQFG
jgi:hypothetical protein